MMRPVKDHKDANHYCEKALNGFTSTKRRMITNLENLLKMKHAYTELNRWHKFESKHFVFHYPQNPTRSENMQIYLKEYASSRDTAFEEICKYLEVDFEGKIDFYLYNSKRHGEILLGRSLGFAIVDKKEIHEYPDQTVGHEMTHIISNFIGKSRIDSAMIIEGLAVYLDRTSQQEKESRLKEALKINIPKLKILMKDFRNYSEYLAYPLAESFVKFLIEESGLEKFKALWTSENSLSFSKVIRNVYGMSLGEIEKKWEKGLKEFRRRADLD